MSRDVPKDQGRFFPKESSKPHPSDSDLLPQPASIWSANEASSYMREPREHRTSSKKEKMDLEREE